MSTSTAPVRRGRPATLSPEQVEDAAFELVQRQGYSSSSMRELARILGVSAMTVQRVSGGRDALDEALVRRLVENERQPRSAWPDTWREVLVEYALLFRRLCRRHPAILAAFNRRPLNSPYAQEVVDLVLGTLRQAGLSSQQAATSFMAVRHYVTGQVSVELNRGPDQRLDHLPKVTHMTDALAWLEHPETEDQFRAGLHVVLAGIDSLVQQDSPPSEKSASQPGA